MDFDYEKLGFKCGLEIHQRLNTQHKLFCKCSALESGNKIGSVIRRIRAVASEMGEFDRAALEEQKKGLWYEYEVYDKSTCLVELDEEPPGPINEEALKKAILIARLFNCKIVDELHVMRKGVFDGSNTSGFQRTALVGYDGFIEVNGKKIPITSVYLEEESAGNVSQEENKRVYRLDRLGIPLVEIDTAPVISSPKEVMDVAKKIGYMIRVAGFAQRGIGTIRQDVNISIKEGARVEIKGLQEIEDVEKVVENEVQRQIELIGIKIELNKRKASIGKEKRIEHILKGTGSNIISKNLGVAVAVKLENFKGILGRKICGAKSFGKEVSEYAGIGLMHSDEDLEKYGLERSRIEKIEKELEMKENDAFLIVFGEEKKVIKGLEKIKERLKIAFDGVPEETRAVARENLSIFLRPLPGKARMYPETDVPPLDLSQIKKATENERVQTIEELEKELEKELGGKEKAKEMIVSRDLDLYLELKKFASPDVVYSTLQKVKSIRRKGIEVSKDKILDALDMYSKGKITKQAIEVFLSESKPKEEFLKEYSKMDFDEIVEKLKEIKKAKGIESKEDLLKAFMEKYRLLVDGSEVKKAIELL